MALVSYVDILEVVGELNDFKAKLVEGEQIAQRGGVTDLSVRKASPREGCWAVSALCQSGTESTPHVVSVSVCEPRSVDCQCSCLHGESGKCKHVVATLMHIHRNDLTIASLKDLVVDVHPQNRSGIIVVNGSALSEDALASNTCAPSFSETIISATVPKSEIAIDRNLQTNDDLNEICVLPCQNLVQDVPLTMDIKMENLEDNTSEQSNSEIRKIPVVQPRMGRGQRKTVPNPKYLPEAKRYVCLICSKGFGKKAHYDEHLRSHSGEKPFVCDVCGQRYSQKRSLLKHKENCGCNTALPSSCPVCDKIFKSKIELADHMSSHTEENEFKCSECGKLFDDKTGFETHQCVIEVHSIENKTDGDGNLFVCDECGETFKKLTQLTEHKQSHTDKKPFKCLECGRSFTRQRTLMAHKHEKPDIADKDTLPSAPHPKRRAVIKCETCGKEFTNRVHHEEHVRSHTGERPFQCVECGKGFATKRSLRNHSHGGKNARVRPHKCSQCPASFTAASMLKIHEKVHTGEKPFSCDECGKAYRFQHIFQDHLNHHKGIKAHTCKECGKSFTWRTSLWAHSRDHAKAKPFECVQCGEKFSEQSKLKDHWEVHADDKPFQCPDCGLGFMLQADCDKHTEIHKGSPSYNCSKCSEKFVLADELHRHMQTHKEKKKYLCPTCGQTFSSKGHLKVHTLIHTGEKPFECETCHKRFYTRSLMRKHAVFHSNERPFECALCGDKFPTQGILRAHIRTHTGERPYSCEECGKSFPQSTYLKRHMLTHSGDRPFPCPDCDNAFISRYDLKIHMRIHTGEKPFSCEECSEQFYERGQLTAHQRLHTGEKPHVCDVCGKGFNSSNLLKKHFDRLHPDTAPFSCTDCGERFVMRDALRKHKRTSHFPGADVVKKLVEESDKSRKGSSSKDRKDPLNRLIEDSQIFVDDASNSSCEPVNLVHPTVLTQEYEIVHVNLVDSSELIKLPEGFKCETVQVYHAESLVEFGENSDFQTVSITPLSEEEQKDTKVVLSSECEDE